MTPRLGPRRGFVLIIVIALLGVMAYLALDFAQKSKTSRDLSLSAMGKSRSKLMARSGVEWGGVNVLAGMAKDPCRSVRNGTPASLLPISGSNLDDSREEALVSVRDANGCININDGVMAGRMELGSGYNPKQLDPWPGGVFNASGYINLRLRNLLNALGDVTRALELNGWPTWASMAAYPLPAPTWTGGGNLYYSQQPKIKGPLYRTMLPNPIALGDSIITARPVGGFKSLSEIRALVNAWGIGNGLNDGLFDRLSPDLTCHSYEDMKMSRLEKEFVGTMYGIAQAEPSLSTNYPWDFNTWVDGLCLEKDGLSMGGCFKPHSAALLNINSATPRVRVAMFHAITNIRLSSNVTHHAGLMMSGPSNSCFGQPGYTASGYGQYMNPFYLVGAANTPVYKTDSPSPFDIKDAFTLALAFGVHDGAVERVDCPAAFGRFLAWKRTSSGAPAYRLIGVNRVISGTSAGGMGWKFEPENQQLITPNRIQDGVGHDFPERALPLVLMPGRRWPGFLHAPLSMLHPYLHFGTYYRNALHTSSVTLLQYEIEDWVFREHLPQLDFMPCGVFIFDSTGRYIRGQQTDSTRITATVKLFDKGILRSQKDFSNHVVPATSGEAFKSSSEIRLGPNAAGAAPDVFVGVLGLKDHINSPGAGPQAVFLPFTDSLDPDPSGGSFVPEDSETDPQIGIVKTEVVPGAGYPVKWSTPWQPDGEARINTLLSSTPAANETFRVPRDALETLNEMWSDPALGLLWNWFDPMMYSSPMSAAEMQQTMEAMWSIYQSGYGYGGPPDPAAATLEEHLYYLIYAPDWNDAWGSDDSIWLKNWSNGPPMASDNSELRGSVLEGNDRAFRLDGADGSDLSPFNGVSFFPFKHGPVTPGIFTDSLYFRPDNLLLAGQKTGDVFGKAYISLWYRNPSSMASDMFRYTIFRCDFWEKIQLKDSGGFLHDSYRPAYVEAYLRYCSNSSQANTLPGTPGFKVFVEHGNSQVESTSGQPPSILTWPYAGYTNLGISPCPLDVSGFPAGVMGCPSPLPDLNPATDWGSWFNIDAYGAEGIRIEPVAPAGFDDNLGLPGTWNRLVVGWNFTLPEAEGKRRFWAAVPTALMSAPSRYSTTSMISGNGRMQITFGESAVNPPGVWNPPAPPTVNIIGGMPSVGTSSIPLDNNYLQPLFRLNSALDNIDMRFGTTGPVNFQDDIPLLESSAGQESKRHNVTKNPLYEPKCVLRPDVDLGSHLISFEARIHDVPNMGSTLYRAPQVELGAVDADHPGLAPSYVPASKPFTSKSLITFSMPDVGPALRFTLTYKATDPEGNDINPQVPNIPWITEVSWRVVPPGGPKVLSWSQE